MLRDIYICRKNWAKIITYSLYFLAISISVSYADQKEGRSEAETAISAGRTQIESLIHNMPDSDQIPGYAGTNVKEKSLDNDKLLATETHTIDDITKSARDSVVNVPSQITLNPKKYKQSLDVQENPNQIFNLDQFLGGSYTDCKEQFQAGQQAQTFYCDGWRTDKHAHCVSRRQVDVKADVKYGCHRDSKRIHATCTETLDRQCLLRGDCSAADIVQKTGHSSNKNDFPVAAHQDNRAIFTIGHKQNSRWQETYRATLATKDNKFTFQIENKASLRAFKLTSVSYQDWLAVKINGQTIYIGPEGGPDKKWIRAANYYSVCHNWHTTPGNDRRCRRYGTSFSSHNRLPGSGTYMGVLFSGEYSTRLIKSSRQGQTRKYVDIDLLPYIQNGENTIQTRVIVGYSSSRRITNYGEAWLDFTVIATCCLKWQDTWSKTCD